MKDYFIWKEAKSILYMASIAATWIWTPAVFVSSEKAYFDGLWGFLMFLVPNVLTLILFAFFAGRIRAEISGMTLGDVIAGAGPKQKQLHILVSLIVLVCSTCVQMLGLHAVLASWVGIPEWLSCIMVATAAYAIVSQGGIRTCIKSDLGKYVIMFLGGSILAASAYASSEGVAVYGLRNSDFETVFYGFGLTAAIGLFAAPYADQTFWQRAFCIEPQKIKKIFCGAAFLFAAIPTLFGMVGFFSNGAGAWDITKAFDSLALRAILAVCAFSALLSTLDSNLCAIASISHNDFRQNVATSKASMVVLLALSAAIMCATKVGITDMFLFYGTVRTCVALPTVLIILKAYNQKRLFAATLASVLVCPVGYIMADEHRWFFTVLALLLPALGFSMAKKGEINAGS